MSVYSHVFLPWAMDLMMTKPHLMRYRREVLAGASGHVLELGMGTGCNLPLYPNAVTKITAIDVNPGMSGRAKRRAAQAPAPVELRIISGERLPMADATFDTVVSTWTLCSIPDVSQALREVRRVLKPGGRFVFIEHGLSDDPRIQRWQHRLTPWFKRPLGGCHMDRKIDALITGAGFAFADLKRFYLEKEPKVAAYSYLGTAQHSHP